MLGTRQDVRRSWPRTLGYLFGATLVAAAGTVGVVLLAVFNQALAEVGCVVYALVAGLVLAAVTVLYAVLRLLRTAVWRSSWAPCPSCHTPTTSGL